MSARSALGAPRSPSDAYVSASLPSRAAPSSSDPGPAASMRCASSSSTARCMPLERYSQTSSSTRPRRCSAASTSGT
jgi:hypothetical protein